MSKSIVTTAYILGDILQFAHIVFERTVLQHSMNFKNSRKISSHKFPTILGNTAICWDTWSNHIEMAENNPSIAASLARNQKQWPDGK